MAPPDVKNTTQTTPAPAQEAPAVKAQEFDGAVNETKGDVKPTETATPVDTTAETKTPAKTQSKMTEAQMAQQNEILRQRAMAQMPAHYDYMPDELNEYLSQVSGYDLDSNHDGEVSVLEYVQANYPEDEYNSDQQDNRNTSQILDDIKRTHPDYRIRGFSRGIGT